MHLETALKHHVTRDPCCQITQGCSYSFPGHIRDTHVKIHAGSVQLLLSLSILPDVFLANLITRQVNCLMVV